ncbi:SsgA family sporulation/cell division regulator [Kitasatospora sp. NBC_01560]|uniref:SsgA family sporulation/cell division regulator n=1 Tax=Kitasatospora sp. NBC_01560 TaxID=2975965 RepID=UPI003869D316
MQSSAVRQVLVTFRDSLPSEAPVAAELRFDAALPYAARLAFPLTSCSCTGAAAVCWYFSRDLLDEGRRGPAGDGDVAVRPGSPGEVLITLRGPDGEAVLSVPEDAVTGFLLDTFALVPAGSEPDFLDIDAGLARLRAAG